MIWSSISACRSYASFQRSSILDVADVGCLAVNRDQLDAQDFGEVLDLLGGHGLAQHRVVRAAGINPGGGGRFQVGRGFQTARATGSRGNGCGGATTSTSFSNMRKRSPRSIIAAFTAGPGGAVKTSRTGSALPPMPSG